MARKPLRSFKDYQAVVVDDSAISRQVLRSLLYQLGIGRVLAVSKVSDARRVLSTDVFDIILCEYNFGEGPGGQDLLEELRRTGGLKLSQVFYMVTSEASYQRVAEVAEIAPDDYLLKPLTGAALHDRLLATLERKSWMAELHEAFDEGLYDEAVIIGERMLAENHPYPFDVARLCAEIYLRIGRQDDATRLYDFVLASRAVPWAKLGMARAQSKNGDIKTAQATLDALIEENPNYVDAYDTMATVLVEQSRYADALGIHLRALSVTPNSVARLQRAGQLACDLGDAKAAEDHLSRAVKIGINSEQFDPRSLLQLAQIKLQDDRYTEAARVLEGLPEVMRRVPEGPRKKWLLRMGEVLNHVSKRRIAEALGSLQSLASTIRSHEVNFPLALDFLTVARRMHERECDTELPQWLVTATRRFAVNRASLQLIEAQFTGAEEMLAIVRQEWTSLNEEINRHMMQVARHRFRDAALALLAMARHTANARVVTAANHASIKAQEQKNDPDIAAAVVESARLVEQFAQHGARPT